MPAELDSWLGCKDVLMFGVVTVPDLPLLVAVCRRAEFGIGNELLAR